MKGKITAIAMLCAALCAGGISCKQHSVSAPEELAAEPETDTRAVVGLTARDIYDRHTPSLTVNGVTSATKDYTVGRGRPIVVRNANSAIWGEPLLVEVFSYHPAESEKRYSKTIPTPKTADAGANAIVIPDLEALCASLGLKLRIGTEYQVRLSARYGNDYLSDHVMLEFSKPRIAIAQAGSGIGKGGAITVNLDEPIIVKDANDACGKSLFVSLVESNPGWDVIGTEAVEWQDAASRQSFLAGTFDLRAFATKTRFTLNRGRYYRVKIALSDDGNWHESVALVYAGAGFDRMVIRGTSDSINERNELVMKADADNVARIETRVYANWATERPLIDCLFGGSLYTYQERPANKAWHKVYDSFPDGNNVIGVADTIQSWYKANMTTDSPYPFELIVYHKFFAFDGSIQYRKTKYRTANNDEYRLFPDGFFDFADDLAKAQYAHATRETADECAKYGTELAATGNMIDGQDSYWYKIVCRTPGTYTLGLCKHDPGEEMTFTAWKGSALAVAATTTPTGVTLANGDELYVLVKRKKTGSVTYFEIKL